VILKQNGSVEPLYVYPKFTNGPSPSIVTRGDDRLESVPTTPGLGLWRETISGVGGPTRYRVQLDKPSINDAIRLRILITDPLGRWTEQIRESSKGSPILEPDILNRDVRPAPGKGFILTFITSVPVVTTPIGSYSLEVEFTPITLPSLPPGPKVRVRRDLPNIRQFVSEEDPFSDPNPIPLRLDRTRDGRTPIAIYLRGRISDGIVKLQSPDGEQVATWNLGDG